jgi:subtilisin-like proprotein convertase family protein
VAAVIGAHNTQFDLTFPAQTAGGTYTVTIGPNVADVAGNLMDQNVNGVNGEADDRYAGSTVLSTPVVRRPKSLDHGLRIADGARTVSVLVVGEQIRITDLNVRLSLTHGHASDLAVTLVSPNGRRAVLDYRRGGDGDGFAGTVFDDEAAQHMADGAAPFTGKFRPEEALAAFDGEDARGTWQLVIDDVSAGTAGRLTGWSLVLSGTPFAGPSDPPSDEPGALPPPAIFYDAPKEARRNRSLWSDFSQFFPIG